MTDLNIQTVTLVLGDPTFWTDPFTGKRHPLPLRVVARFMFRDGTGVICSDEGTVLATIEGMPR